MRTPGAIVRRAVALVALCGCSTSEPAEVVERLSAPDRQLSARVRPASGTWDGLSSPGWRSARMGPFYDVGARLPTRADGALALGIGQSPAFLLTLVAEGAQSAPVADDAGRAIYRAAWPSTDLVFVASEKRVEWLLVLADEHAPASFAWRVTLPSQLPTVRPQPSGGLVIADQGGTARLRIPTPYALDARGRRRDAELAYAEGRLAVRLDTRGLSFPILLDPAVETAVWQPKIVPPGPRYSGGMVYDSARSLTILFGGFDRVNRLGDTWQWDGATWTLRAATGPSGRSSFGMAYDSARSRTVLHGGYAGAGNLRDTWEWDGLGWTQRATTGPARASPGLAYDAARQQTILFGGYGGAGDSWAWDGTTWTQVATTGPSSRSDVMMAYDVTRQRVVLFGGYSAGSEFGDTWEWDGATWTERATTGPTAREDGGIVYDSTRGKMVLFGGDTTTGGSLAYLNDLWTWDGAAWTQISAPGPGARSLVEMAYDPVRDRVVLQGGFSGGFGSDETWEFDGATWTQRSAAPSRRQQHVLAYDSARARTVLFGGASSETGSVLFGDTWEFDGTLWSQRASTGPSARREAALVFDSSRSRSLLFGGSGAGYYGDTWEWDGSTWTQVASTGPSPRSNIGMAYDSGRNRTVLFGGASTSGDVGDTWEWNGSGWTQRATTGPMARADAALAFDSGRSRTVLFGGYNPAGGTFGTFLGDTWEWDGSSWTQRNGGSPGGRSNHAMAYDSATGKTVLYGGLNFYTSGIVLGDTSEWDGTSWISLGSTGPVARDEHAMAFDSGRRRVVMFGLGNDNLNTWEFHARGGPCTTGAQCDTGFCVDSVCCEASSCTGACNACNVAGSPGVCHAADAGSPGNPSCAPFACDGTATNCPTSCSTDSACASDRFCMGGACALQLPSGQTCARGRQCQSGFCVGGVCCGTLCNGACQTCSATPGTCTSLSAGATGSPSCAPYLCDGAGASCPTSCTGDSSCAPLARCVSGRCAYPLSNGSACTVANACMSNLCIDGRCCDSACTGACVACNRPGALGTCGQVAAGTDPRAACPGSGPCKALCDGSGACAYPGSTLVCRASTCVDTMTEQRAGTCDGQGACMDNGTTACTPYHCASGQCLTSCTSSSQCVAPNVCQGTMCAPLKNLGESCGGAAECMSGFCAGGVCCDSACTGTCQACNRPGALGTCGIATGLCGLCTTCDSSGQCSQPAADDSACGTISCAGLSTECRVYADLMSTRCAAAGLCHRPNDPAVCTQSTDRADGTPCSAGMCLRGQCVARPPVDAGTDAGTAGGGGSSGEGGCGCAVGARARTPAPWWLVALLLLYRPRFSRRRAL